MKPVQRSISLPGPDTRWHFEVLISILTREHVYMLQCNVSGRRGILDCNHCYQNIVSLSLASSATGMIIYYSLIVLLSNVALQKCF